jgi:xanthine dehydrogenase molybdopterin-binding subunit B
MERINLSANGFYSTPDLLGRPINPSIDVGQIEGAFTQGLGWCTIEEPLISPLSGFLLVL